MKYTRLIAVVFALILMPGLVLAGTTGTSSLSGGTSGTITIQPQAAAGTYNFNLPMTVGTSGYVLTSQGGGSSAMTWSAPSAPNVSTYCTTGIGTDLHRKQRRDVEQFIILYLCRCLYMRRRGQGGGGKADTAGNNTSGGGGGGGGGCVEQIFRASDLTSTVTVTLGSGGSTSSGNATGQTGGNSTFGSYLTAYGGSGGQLGASGTGSNGGAGGDFFGVGGSASNKFGGIGGNTNGGTGGSPSTIAGAGGGGGHAAAGSGSGGWSWGGGPGGGAGGAKISYPNRRSRRCWWRIHRLYIAARCRSEPRRKWRRVRQCRGGLSVGLRRRGRVWEYDGHGWQRKRGHERRWRRRRWQHRDGADPRQRRRGRRRLRDREGVVINRRCMAATHRAKIKIFAKNLAP